VALQVKTTQFLKASLGIGRIRYSLISPLPHTHPTHTRRNGKADEALLTLSEFASESTSSHELDDQIRAMTAENNSAGKNEATWSDVFAAKGPLVVGLGEENF
jgi:hypothetical protein